MSASSTHPTRRITMVSCSSWSAACAPRPGRNPYEQSSTSCSCTASRIIATPRWTTLSSIVGMPMGLCFPPSFGIHTLRTGGALYRPLRSLSYSPRRFASRFAAYSCPLCRSTPTAPSFRTRCHASFKNSSSTRCASDVNRILGRSLACRATRSSFGQSVSRFPCIVLVPPIGSSPVGPFAPEALPSFFATTSPSDFSTPFGTFSGLPSSVPTTLAGGVQISQVPQLILGSVLPASIPAGTVPPRLVSCTVAAFDDPYRLSSRENRVSRLNPFTCVAAHYLAVYASRHRSLVDAQDSLLPCSAKLWAEDFSYNLPLDQPGFFLALKDLRLHRVHVAYGRRPIDRSR